MSDTIGTAKIVERYFAEGCEIIRDEHSNFYIKAPGDRLFREAVIPDSPDDYRMHWGDRDDLD